MLYWLTKPFFSIAIRMDERFSIVLRRDRGPRAFGGIVEGEGGACAANRFHACWFVMRSCSGPALTMARTAQFNLS